MNRSLIPGRIPDRVPDMSHNMPKPRLTDNDLDRALNADQDAILPASGFADSVMTAICREASAPAPIPFPWRRALPGLAAAVLVLFGLIAAVVFVVRSAPAGTPAPSDSSFLTAQLASLLHPASATLLDAFWLGSSLALAFACLLVCRRLIFAR